MNLSEVEIDYDAVNIYENMVDGVYLTYEYNEWQLLEWDDGWFYYNMPIKKFADAAPEYIYGPLP
jgi:hypothetical protein